MSSNAIPILAKGLSKHFGPVQAVAQLDIEISHGEALGLLGPNGAGKSTTLSMLRGLVRPDAGQIEVFGHPAGHPAARRLVGATPQSTAFPDQLTPREILDYTAARYGNWPNIETLAESFGLENLIDRRVSGFSGGELRRVALGLAFVGKPRLVFLDEPTSGLDTNARETFNFFVRDYVNDGGSLVLTSHHWDEIEAVCNTVALIDGGEMVLAGRLEDIRARTHVKLMRFALPNGTTPPDWMSCSLNGDMWRVETAQGDATVRRMIDENIPFRGLVIEPLKLSSLIDRIREEESAK